MQDFKILLQYGKDKGYYVEDRYFNKAWNFWRQAPKDEVACQGRELFTLYASFPVLLTPDLLHKLRFNFKNFKASGLNQVINPVSVSDLLFSGLCREVTRELFEIPDSIRFFFLNILKDIDDGADIAYNFKVELPKDLITRIAVFTQYYATQSIQLRSYYDKITLKALQVNADLYLNPAQALYKITQDLVNNKSDSMFQRQFLLITEQILKGVKATSIFDKKRVANDKSKDYLNFLLSYTQSLKKFYIEGNSDGILNLIEESLAADNKQVNSILLPIPYKFELNIDTSNSGNIVYRLITENKRTQSPTLDLGNCGLTELPDLSGMEWIETLIVSNEWWDQEQRKWIKSQNVGPENKIARPTTHHLPSSLRKIEMSGRLGTSWPISDGRFLQKLTNLTSLNISNTNISDVRFLEKLTKLTSLDLSYNHISDARFLEKLTNLTSLNIRNTNISDVRFLEKLTKLTSLDLSNNRIRDARFLEKLTNLTSLNISNNRISDARFLEKLTKLTSLDLSYNHISDARFLGKLNGLILLNLSYNQIRDAHFLEKLIKLTSLNLSNNQISNWRFLEKLTRLTSLELRNTKINDARFLKKLVNLTQINLAKNQLDSLVPLRYFFEEKGMMVKYDDISNITNGEINVYGNPLTTPPVEIVQQGNDALLNYFKQIDEQGGTAPLYEARLIMVGEPGAGKTSLTEKLLDENHLVKPDDPHKKSTVGINVKENWRFDDCQRPGEHFSAHIWDFGGQEIQYRTHQFFLTPESMYVLVADDRKQHSLFPYWFEAIRLLGKDEVHGHSPVLVVLNERNNKSITNFDLNDYRLRYPDMNIQVCEVDLCDSNLSRFSRLRQQIQESLCSLPHAGRPLPAKWSLIRTDLTALKERGRNHISMREFRELCAAHKVVRDEDLALISLYLHRLGAILHFYQDRGLRDFIVISPAWALKAIYAVLEDKAVEKANGFFTDKDLDRYWKDLDDMERDKVLGLMKRESFEIVYPVDNGYVAPQLLSKVRPAFEWDSSASLKYRFYYRFMPKGILTRLIVRKHAHIQAQKLVWAQGVVLHFAGCDMLVVEQETEKDGIIQIEVQGKGREGIRALDFVRNEIEEIHKKWFSNIDFQPMVPCDCEDCQKTAAPTYFKLESLIKRLDQGRSEIECENNRVKDVPVRRLLEGVYDPADIAQKMERERHMNIHVYAHDPKAHEKLDRLEHTTAAIETTTNLIQSNQETHSRQLSHLLQFAAKEQAMLEDIFVQIDALPASDAADIGRIDELLEEQFGKLLDRLPDEHEIVAAWKKATAKAPDEVDMKWKLKFKLPLIFGEVEKELAWDGKKMLKSIREELTAYARGEKTFRDLFWED